MLSHGIKLWTPPEPGFHQVRVNLFFMVTEENATKYFKIADIDEKGPPSAADQEHHKKARADTTRDAGSSSRASEGYTP